MKIKLISISLLLMLAVIACSNNNCNNINTESLKDAYKNRFLIGTAISEYHLSNNDENTLNIVKSDFNSLTPENIMKWEMIHPEPDSFNFAPSDKIVEFALANNMFLIGHTLVWHSQTPNWVFQHPDGNNLTRDELINLMKNHIQTVVGRFKGKVKAWDVVNEAFEDDGSLRNSKWLQIIGEDYIELAFKFAKEADPDAELYYNDYSMYKPEKCKAIVDFFGKLIRKGVKVDGIGLQAHWFIGDPTYNAISASIKEYKTLGVDIMLTELDLSVLPNPYNFSGADISTRFKLTPEMNPFPDGMPDSVEQKQAEAYADIFKILLDNSDAVSRVTFWGVHDKHSWKNNFPIPGRTDYALLFNRKYQPKKAYKALIDLVNTSASVN